MKSVILFHGFLLLFLLNGCGGIPKDALSMNPETLEDRILQTRYFEDNDEKEIIAACAALLQDLGFNLDESETELGLLVGSKDRDATDAGQVVGAIVVAALIGGPTRYDEAQKIRASVVTSLVGENQEKTSVRVTFQRIVWDNYGQITRLERLNEPEMYQGFFDKLSKSVFLEAQGI